MTKSGSSESSGQTDTLSGALPNSEVIHKARLIRLFMSEAERDPAAEQIHAAGSVLMKQGDSPDGVYLVRSGEIDIFEEAAAGRVHLDRLGPGACVGELGTLAGSPRAATVVAAIECRTLFIPAPRFRELYHDSAALRLDLEATKRAYQTSDGTIRQYSEAVQGQERVTTVFDRTGGRTVVSARTLGVEGYELEALPGPGERQRVTRRLRARDEAGVLQYEVRLTDGAAGPVAVGLTAYVDREDLGTADLWVREGLPLDETMLAALETGTVAEAPTPVDLFCRCLRIPVETVRAAIAAGAETPTALQERTGCGTVCGSCRSRMAPLFANAAAYVPSIDLPTMSLDVLQPRPGTADIAGVSADEPPPPSLLRELKRRIGATFAVLSRVRSVVVLLGALLFVPLLVAGVLTTTQAVLWAVVVLGLFARDVEEAYREWRELFLEGVTDDVQITARDRRPPGFAAPIAPDTPLEGRAIRGILMGRLSFGAWMFYKYSLRLDYAAQGFWRFPLHQIRKRLLARGYTLARTWSGRYQPFWEEIPRQLGELILESSLCMGCAHIRTDADSGHRIGTFRFDDWQCPAGPRFEDESLYVHLLELEVDLESRRALRCTVNGESLGVTNDALAVTFMALSTYHHSLVHAYANWACVPNHPDPLLARAAVYTLSINATAVIAGSVVLDNPKHFTDQLTYNAMKGMYPHGSGQLLSELCRYSRLAAFLLKARVATMEVLAAHRVDVDAEAFFLMSVMHSLDHYCASMSCDPVSLQSPLLDSRGPELVRVMFSEPLRMLLVNTKLSSRRESWAVELYRRLEAINPEYAALVDYCISY